MNNHFKTNTEQMYNNSHTNKCICQIFGDNGSCGSCRDEKQESAYWQDKRQELASDSINEPVNEIEE